jgi:hypothetical protein
MPEELEQIRDASFMKAHEYILIKPHKTAGDIRYINNYSMKVDAASGQSSVQIGEIMFASVVRMVRGWNITRTLKQPDGSTQEVPLVFDPKNVAACVEELPGPYFEFIFAEITKRNPPMTAGEQNSFLAPAMNGSVGEPNVFQQLSLSER